MGLFLRKPNQLKLSVCTQNSSTFSRCSIGPFLFIQIIVNRLLITERRSWSSLCPVQDVRFHGHVRLLKFVPKFNCARERKKNGGKVALHLCKKQNKTGASPLFCATPLTKKERWISCPASICHSNTTNLSVRRGGDRRWTLQQIAGLPEVLKLIK